MRRISFLLPFLAACASRHLGGMETVPSPPLSNAGSKGSLVIVGGGGTSEAMLARALELAGGAHAHVVILPQASGAEDRGVGSAAMWRTAGAASVELLDPLVPETARMSLASADLIWFPGGDQSRLMEALIANDLVLSIADRYRDGATIGGTSAGAAVMSQVMITGEADLESITAGATLTAPGLGLWPEVVIDQHFVARRRANRLISAVLDRPDLLGVGIDERAAVIYSGGRLEVMGEGSVVVIDARAATVRPARPGERAAGRGLALHVLRDGDTLVLDE